MLTFTGTYTDQYQLTMAQTYFFKGRANHSAVFDYFFRKLPFDGGYAIFAGLEDLLTALEHLKFNDEDLQFLKQQQFAPEFIEYLKQFRFHGNIYASQEGDVVFPTRPVIIIEANILEAQMIETLVLNILNFQTLIATKANRMRQVAGQRQLIDFGLRRAQGAGGYYATRAAFIGGFDATSNVVAGRDYGIPVSGTMSHAFIQSYDDEYSAFHDFSQVWPDECVLLVDTYDTLKSGVPNAIKIGKELEAKGHRLRGIRLDSGDLALLAKQSRQLLDEAGMHYVKIAASNQLDEFVIKQLLEQKAPIDVFGVGTNLVIGQPDGALDGVYKLVFADDKPRIKLSENISKVTIPGKKQVHRILKDDIFWGADVISLDDEEDMTRMYCPFNHFNPIVLKNLKQEPLLKQVVKNGKRTEKPKSLKEIAHFSQDRLKLLPKEFKRFDDPSVYKIGISEQLKTIRDQLIHIHKG
ncbi:nicotinate phosphoribosyltransferase [Legionella oakridgensis]|uniref:Nicotinate phosphoribosyltransferase n=2 Tax=Legionella oakridgensis TaxID=29423 RepID=W0BEG2_9GAMM|nr:nicotinate phosphoribosyltransferase [Legionella oakridgensis]AHE67022.1 putative nicotinate phosphoribosyltransferase [Legionella oakridgensis ATCC 33761 = DSM 21215]ETO93310.1 putative nicotinate phosphoribosyltransferase [Legionella oakridgensis RV-2-2007]KTD37175.1 nicotinate phosphoribosyltransferase [Legionella oakridgensis]STY20120.1 nicotinate phosphoribosyltransferase [Legionella longbeachae]